MAEDRAVAARKNRSNAMVVLGALMFAIMGLASLANPGADMGAGAIVLGLLGVGLIVGGLVIRP